MESYPRSNVHIENRYGKPMVSPEKKKNIFYKWLNSPHLYVSLWDIYDTTILFLGFPK
jgi:hypothetical protein